MDYEGMFAVFNELNTPHHGAPHPMAALQLTPEDATLEREMHEAVDAVAVALARAALAGEAELRLDLLPPDPAVAVFRAGYLLDLSAHWHDETGRVRLGRDLDAHDRERLSRWLTDR